MNTGWRLVQWNWSDEEEEGGVDVGERGTRGQQGVIRGGGHRQGPAKEKRREKDRGCGKCASGQGRQTEEVGARREEPGRGARGVGRSRVK